jgi:DNA polymerase III subunit epsilon
MTSGGDQGQGIRHEMGRLRLDRPVVFLDTETTGTDPANDRVVQVGLIKLHPDGAEELFRGTGEVLVNPERPIPLESTQIHGITDEMVRTAPTFEKLADSLLEFMAGNDLAGYNLLRFDVPLLQAEFARVLERRNRTGQVPAKPLWDPLGEVADPDGAPPVRILDPQVIFHRREPRDLSAAVRFYCGHELTGAHGALADTRAALEVLLGQVRRYEDLPAEVEGLHRESNPPDARFVDRTRKLAWRRGEPALAFGRQHRDRPIRELARDSDGRGYLQWMQGADFSPEVKKLIGDALEGKVPQRNPETGEITIIEFEVPRGRPPGGGGRSGR